MYDPTCAKCGTGAEERIPERPKYGFGFEGAAFKDHQVAAICYAGWFLTGIALLFVQPYCRSKLVRFHAQQAILLTAAWLVLMLTVSVWVPLGMRMQSFSTMWMFGLVVHFTLALLTILRFDPAIPLLSTMARKNL
jgi:uncharacterized membrane protein